MSTLKILGVTLIHVNECHFFISIIIMIKRDKMITMYLKTFITKILLFIFINLLSTRELVDTPIDISLIRLYHSNSTINVSILATFIKIYCKKIVFMLLCIQMKETSYNKKGNIQFC